MPHPSPMHAPGHSGPAPVKGISWQSGLRAALIQGTHLNPEQATERPGTKVGLRTVVPHEHAAVAALTMERTA